jgi:hypothetical protein
MGMFAVSWSVSTRLWGRAAFSTALPDQTCMSDTLLMPFTVLSAEFAHETNTFSRRHTTHADFMARSRCLQGDAAIAGGEHVAVGEPGQR